MKSIISRTMLLVALCATLFSFSDRKGGEGFEIYINGKLVLQQYGTHINDAGSLQLDQQLYNDQITIKYYHCGRVGKNRVVTIKNGQNKVMKEWRYADEATPLSAMACNVKDILNLRKGNGNIFKLYYSCSELPNGRLLTSIVAGTENTSKP